MTTEQGSKTPSNALRRFKKGDHVRLRIDGAGVTSYEDDVVRKVTKGRVLLVDSTKEFDAQTGEWLGVDDFMGWRFSIDKSITDAPQPPAQTDASD